MNVWKLHWLIAAEEEDHGVRRYCSSCGKMTEFRDSGIRRHNANGKNIYRYAIYKCSRDHTWNNKLEEYKAGDKDGVVRELLLEETPAAEDAAYVQESSPAVEALQSRLDLNSPEVQAAERIDIRLVSVSGSWRLDKLLARRVAGPSRTQWAAWIAAGAILLDDRPASGKHKLRCGETITLFPELLR